MITSGCTGWEPNAARLLVADDIMGEWTEFPNPAKGKGAHRTFESQSTYILPVEGKKDAFIFHKKYLKKLNKTSIKHDKKTNSDV